MSSVYYLEFVLLTAVTVFISAIAWWSRKHPNRSKEYPERVRMPRIVPFFGWALGGFGLLLGLWAWTAPDGPLDARITSLALVLAGLAFVMMYRNFYVAPRKYEVAFRTALGREHVLPYSDIATYSVMVGRGQRILTVKSVHGPKLSVNIRTFDVSPLLKAIDYHQVTGRWPARVGIPAQRQSVPDPGIPPVGVEARNRQ